MVDAVVGVEGREGTIAAIAYYRGTSASGLAPCTIFNLTYLLTVIEDPVVQRKELTRVYKINYALHLECAKGTES